MSIHYRNLLAMQAPITHHMKITRRGQFARHRKPFIVKTIAINYDTLVGRRKPTITCNYPTRL